ncbi:MAG TPA: tetratricopeptide repeat protein, partial [Bryobacterales bacterium]|nr:tetratricopeptide repeat protein [Bryobacterales bacterium]
EGDPVARRVSTSPPLSQSQVVEFWAKQRLAMDALKKENNIPKAASLFREAVALNPEHEDSRYYLANCLYAQGDTAGALEQLDALIRINPQSHRGYQRKGLLLAVSAANRAQLVTAGECVRQAQTLNPEETGTLLLLGEIALLKGDTANARRQLELACRTNPKAVGGYFLRGYLAWKSHDLPHARELLLAASNARGKDWKPAGAVAEGDVRARMHTEGSILSSVWDNWNGSTDPEAAYSPADRAIKMRAMQTAP